MLHRAGISGVTDSGPSANDARLYEFELPSIRVKDAAAIFAAGEFLAGLHGDDGGGDELHVAAAAFAILHRRNGEAGLCFHEALVERED
jgi:hypothetical protein